MAHGLFRDGGAIAQDPEVEVYADFLGGLTSDAWSPTFATSILFGVILVSPGSFLGFLAVLCVILELVPHLQY